MGQVTVLKLLLVAVCLLSPCVLAATASTCIKDADCQGLSRCDTAQSVCQEIGLIDVLLGWKLPLTTTILAITALIASGAGLGGGPIFVPTFIIVMGMSPHQAVPISQTAILGGSIVNLFFFWNQKHPVNEDQPLIDFDTLLVLAPMLLAGTTVGVVLNVILPTWLVVVLILVTLSYSSYKMVVKARDAWKKENNKKAAITNPFKKNKTTQTKQHGGSVEEEEEDLDSTEPLLKKKKSLSTASSRACAVLLILFLWVVVVGLTVLKGDAQINLLQIKFCGSIYWGILGGLVAFLVVFCLLLSKRLYDFTESKREFGWVPKEGEVNWTKKNVSLYPLLSVVAGLLGGMLGVGGALILGPIFLEIGMDSRSSAATSAAAVVSSSPVVPSKNFSLFAQFITSSSALVQFFISKSLLWDYGAWFFGWGLFATFVGQTLIAYIIKKFNR
jgi:uncharacterized membrane protein YfcA